MQQEDREHASTQAHTQPTPRRRLPAVCLQRAHKQAHWQAGSKHRIPHSRYAIGNAALVATRWLHTVGYSMGTVSLRCYQGSGTQLVAHTIRMTGAHKMNSTPMIKRCAVCRDRFTPHSNAKTADARTLCPLCRKAMGTIGKRSTGGA